MAAVREVAAIMHQADPRARGTLYCAAFSWDSLKCCFELQFPFPEGHTNPRSLLDLLLESQRARAGAKHPLDHRIMLAKSLVSGILVLHAADFVHKQIRPDNICYKDMLCDGIYVLSTIIHSHRQRLRT